MENNLEDSVTVEKAVKPEVSKDVLLEVIKELQEVIVGILEVEEEDPEMENDPTEAESPDMMGKSNDLSDEEISKSYDSENEEEDKWDNIEKACWSGYKQVGMKDKNGRRVPNCVPVKKSLFGTEGPQTLIPRNK
jgi:hypothetical protein